MEATSTCECNEDAEYVTFFDGKGVYACGDCMNAHEDANPGADWAPLHELRAFPAR